MSAAPRPASPVQMGSVVPLTGVRRAPRGPLWGALIQLSLERFKGDLESFLSKVDDDLFDLAGPKGMGSHYGPGFFEGLRGLRKQRAQVIETALNRLGEAWGRCEQGGGLAPVPAAAPSSVEPAELALVANEVLEEGLAIEGAARHVEGLVKGELLALRHRLAVLKGGVDAAAVIVPVGPEVLLEAFRAGLDAVSVLTTDTKIVIYKLFDRRVLSAIVSLYRTLNETLMQAGILRDWRPPVPTASRPASGDSESGGADKERPVEGKSLAGSPSALGHPVPDRDPRLAAAEFVSGTAAGNWDDAAAVEAAWAPQPTPVETGRVWGFLHRLLNAVRGPPPPPPSVPVPDVPLQDLLSAVSWVRTWRQSGTAPEAWVDPALANPDVGASDGFAAPAARLKAELRSVLQAQMPEGAGSGSLGPQEDVIDMVAYLFDYVARDRVLSAPLQVDLGRLQLPYLRMALLEPELFARPEHPARVLLNALSNAGKGIAGESSDEVVRAVGARIHETVERIAAEHAPGRLLFAAEHDRFQEFMAGITRRTQLRERRLAEVSSGQERKTEALRAVSSRTLPLVRDSGFPNWLSLLLLKPWSSGLVLAYLNEGPASPLWSQAQSWMNDMSAIARHPGGEALRARLHAGWPQWRQTWSAVLQKASLSEEEIERWTAALQKWLAERAGSAPGAAPAPAPALAAQARVLPHIDLPEPPPPAPPALPSASWETAAGAVETDASFLAAAEAMGLGAWVEFAGPPAQRGKLVYISPFSGRMLFVTPSGTKLREMARSDMAQELAAGAAVRLSDTPLFERAMGSIVRQLQERHAPRQPAGAGSPNA